MSAWLGAMRLAFTLGLVLALQTSLYARVAHEGLALQASVHVERDCSDPGDAGSPPVSHTGHFCGHCLPCLETGDAIDAPFEWRFAPLRVVEAVLLQQEIVAAPHATRRAAHPARAPPLFS